jgi:peptide/nickel transport system substrate-binding protein
MPASNLNNLKLQWLILVRYISRNKLKVFLSIFLVSLLFLGIFKLGPLLYSQKSLTEGVIGTYQAHDIPDVVLNLLSQPLVIADTQGRFKPNLATDWQVNEEVTSFKFKLKDNLKWSDGTPVKSTDIDFKIPDVEIINPDEQTIEFKLKSAYSPLPSLLTKPIFKKNTLIGIGPYKVDKLEKSRVFITKLTLSSNDPNLPGINIRFYPNEKTALTAYNLGEIQALFGISDQQISTQDPRSGIFRKTIFNKIISIIYNTKDPLLSNRSFRQTLSYSAPEIKIEEIAKTSIPPFSWAYFDAVNDYLSNSDAAQAALKRAKAASSAELLNKELILTTLPQYENLGNKIIAAWKELGIKVILRVESGIPQNFQALLIAQTIPTDPDQYSLWHSTQTKTNITGYDSKRTDKDLEDGRKSLKEEVRKQSYLDFQKTLLEDSPATFLYFPKYNVLYLKKVQPNLEKVLPLQLPS